MVLASGEPEKILFTGLCLDEEQEKLKLVLAFTSLQNFLKQFFSIFLASYDIFMSWI